MEINDFISSRPWKFAKTMPEHPHEYTLRKTDAGHDQEFDNAVLFIRKFGIRRPFHRTHYVYYRAGEFEYWTMGAPLEETILINRARITGASYDNIADKYDELFTDAESQKENLAIYEMIKAYLEEGSVLDVGCGTGLLLDLHGEIPEGYVGIDPCSKMISKLHSKHPEAATYTIPFGVSIDKKFELIVSLFGSPSYIPKNIVSRVKDMLHPNGKYFLMFYRHKYHPLTYQKTGMNIPHIDYKPEDLMLLFAGDYLFSFGNFMVATNIKPRIA